MDRRGFLRSMIGGVAAAAAVRAWPFRVFSFPSKPIEPEIHYTTLANLREIPDEVFVDTPWLQYFRYGGNLLCNNPRYFQRLTGIVVPTEKEVEEFA